MLNKLNKVPLKVLIPAGLAIWLTGIAIATWWISIPLFLVSGIILNRILVRRFPMPTNNQIETVDVSKPVFLGVNYFPIEHKLTIFRSLQWQAHIYNDMTDQGEFYYAGSLHNLLNKLEKRLGDKRATDLFHSLNTEFYQICFNYELKSPPDMKDYLKVVQ